MTETAPVVDESTGNQSTRLNVVFVDESKDAVDAARLAAEARLTNELGVKGNFLKRLYNDVVKGSLMREYYVLKYQRDAEEQINQENSVLLYEADEQGRVRAEQSLIDRFQSDFDNETVIHEQAGERRDVLGLDSELTTEIKRLIADNVTGQLSDEALVEEKNRALQAFAEHSDQYKGLFKDGKARADNMLDIASAVRSAIDHGESLDTVLANLQIMVGEARSNVRTEVRYGKIDRVIEKLQSTKIGALVGPEVVVTATTLAMSLLRVGSHRAVGAALMTFTPAAAAAMWAGLRENKRVKEERVQHSREMAQGKTIAEGSKRREEMEKSRYETVSATSLIDELRSKFSHETNWQTDDELLDAMATIAAVEARIKYSDREKVDLVSYSSVESIGDERLALDIARAEAKTIAQARLDTTTRQRLGISDSAPISDIINYHAENYLNSEIITDISNKDRVYKKLRRNRVASAVVQGATTGLIIGSFFQEGIATIDSSREGVIEQVWQHETNLIDGQQHNTLLYGLIHGDTLTGEVKAPSGNYVGYLNNHLQLPEDYHVVVQNGELQINDPTGRLLVEGVPVGPDGSMPQTSIDALKAAGIDVDTQTNKTGTDYIEKKLKVKDYIKTNSDDFTHIKRDFWYDNDTPKPVFDKNELGLWKGGVDNSGITKSGDYAYTVANMTEGGSYHDGERVSWSELAEDGKLKAALSISRGTQTNVMLVDIDSNGSIMIDPDSEAGKLFTKDDGELVFKGAYLEIVEVTETEGDTTHVRPLATITGEKSIKSLIDSVPQDKFETVHKLTPPDYETVAPGSFTEMAPVIPVVARRPLESLAARQGAEYYRGGVDRAEELRIREELSPRLQNDPDAKLNTGKEVEWYRSELVKRRGGQRVKDIEEKIAASPELRELSREVKTIITIPVAATQEADNIYHTLSLYAQQDKEAIKDTAVLINLNWLDTSKGDAEAERQISMTRGEIERARRDFPELKIATVENEYGAAEAKKTGGVIGYVVSDLYDTALLSINRRIKAGDMADDHNIVIIRHDADMQGLSRHHLAQFQRSLEQNSSADLFKGMTRFGVRMSERYPGFGIVSNFASGLGFLSTSGGSFRTGGANFGVKASTLAAIGGLGSLRGRSTGAGSDDVATGTRLAVARQASRKSQVQGGYGSYASSDSEVAKAYVRAVAGANIDTNPDRLIPYYLEGRSFQDAWGTFDRNGYKPRLADAGAMDRMPKEQVNDLMYKFIEVNISKELSWSDSADVKRMLAIWFGAVPGAYTVEGRGSATKFTLTDAGKEYIKNRVERESNGRFGPYGMRKMRQLYGNTSGKRQPVPSQSPLVAPL